jgi:hypothetical protein
VTNTPGKVTGGGEVGSSKDPTWFTFGFTAQFRAGDGEPKGSLVFHDHKINLRLKAISFDLLVIDGDQAWLTGLGKTDEGKLVKFAVKIDASTNNFSISIPELEGYEAGGALNGGNISIH